MHKFLATCLLYASLVAADKSESSKIAEAVGHLMEQNIEEKLLYEIMKKGNGQVVESYSRPLIRIKSPSFEAEEILDLDETIPGLKKGIIGMQEGEIRTLYIHPEFGSDVESTESTSLLIFEVEVIKADATTDSHSASNELLSFDLIPIIKNNLPFSLRESCR